MSVGRHRAYSLARTRKSGTELQAPRRRVNSQTGDGVYRQDIEHPMSHLRYLVTSEVDLCRCSRRQIGI